MCCAVQVDALKDEMLARFVVRSHRRHHPSAVTEQLEEVPDINPTSTEKIPQVCVRFIR